MWGSHRAAIGLSIPRRQRNPIGGASDVRSIRSAAVALMAAAMIAAGSAGPASAVVWGPQVPISPRTSVACRHGLATATAGGRTFVYAAYQSDLTSRIFLRRSTDLGVSWEPAITVSQGNGLTDCSAVAADGRFVVVAWVRQGPPPDHLYESIDLRVSADSGRTFGRVRTVPTERRPDIAVSVAITGNRILVAWSDDAGPLLAMSNDRGLTWRTTNLDPQASGPASLTRVAASGPRVFVAWVRQSPRGIAGRLSVDGGTTWQTPDVLAPADTTGNTFPRFGIDVLGDRAALAWTGRDRGAGEDDLPLDVRIFRDGTWQTAVRLEPSDDPVRQNGVTFVSVVLSGSSDVGVAATVCREGLDYEIVIEFPCGPRAMRDVLWWASSDQGATWKPPRLAGPADPFAETRPAAGFLTAVRPTPSSAVILVERVQYVDDAPSRVYVILGRPDPVRRFQRAR